MSRYSRCSRVVLAADASVVVINDGAYVVAIAAYIVVTGTAAVAAAFLYTANCAQVFIFSAVAMTTHTALNWPLLRGSELLLMINATFIKNEINCNNV